MATPVDETDKKAGYASGTEVDASSSFDTINALVAEGSYLPPFADLPTAQYSDLQKHLNRSWTRY